MTTITATKIVYQENLSAKAKAVYTYLAHRSNKDNMCFPALKRIAKECSVSVSSVQRALAELLREGLLKKKANFRENGSQTSNLYTLVMMAEERTKTKEENYKEEIEKIEKQKEELKVQQLKMELEIEEPDLKEELTILEQQDQLKKDDYVEVHEKGEAPTNRKVKYIRDMTMLNTKSKFYEMNLIGIAAKLNILKKCKLKLKNRKKNQKIMALKFQHLTRGGSHSEHPRT